MKTIMKNEDGFTGLEAAIVLIAFIVVAAVFSYVILGAGFFTTQKSQEVVHTGVSQTSSSVEIVGNVYGVASSIDNKFVINKIQFDLGLTAGGSPVDMEKTVMVYSTDSTDAPIYLDFKGSDSADEAGSDEAGWWYIANHNTGSSGDDDNLLERGEIHTVIAQVKNDYGLEANDRVRLEVRPPVGAVLVLDRTVPPQVDKVNVLY